ncbi:hypothetical protein LENED_005101 [Lentinula edodes]|uniref:Uncharacterized protein n=1 Tax=Lentinula edodes TaxID=5353 RepID=A0A1Q3E7Z3_LENED|nr:hypothetical protein LENED_005101 [Lentinula edodes]
MRILSNSKSFGSGGKLRSAFIFTDTTYVEQLQVSILYASEKTKQLQYKLEIDRVRVVSSAASAALGMHTRSNHSLFKRSLYELRQVLKSIRDE